MTDTELLTELDRMRRLKAWDSVQRLEREWRTRHPRRVELAQDAYYYGTAADR